MHTLFLAVPALVCLVTTVAWLIIILPDLAEDLASPMEHLQDLAVLAIAFAGFVIAAWLPAAWIIERLA